MLSCCGGYRYRKYLTANVRENETIVGEYYETRPCGEKGENRKWILTHLFKALVNQKMSRRNSPVVEMSGSSPIAPPPF